jgi:hypothetical protein
MLKYVFPSLLLASCSSGTLTLNLDVPAMDSLNPMSTPEVGRLSSFRLRRADGSPVAESRFFPGEALDLGHIPAGPPTDFDLEGLSESGQILAYGTMSHVAVSANSDVSVTVEVRKPIGYVSGGAQVLVRDTTKTDTGVAAPGTLGGASGASAVISTHDGTHVLVAVGMQIKALTTIDHKDSGITLALTEPARRLVLDRSDKVLAVLGAQSVTLYDIGGWLSGTATEIMGVSANLANAVSADFTLDGAQLLVVTGAPGCSGGCQLHALDAHAASDQGAIGLPEYAADIAVEQASGGVVVALPGRGQLTWLDNGGQPTMMQAATPRAQIVLSNGAALVGFGNGDTRNDPNAKASAVVVLPNQPPRKTDLAMPDLIASFSSDPTSPNQANAKITTAQFVINRAAMTPDAARALLWVTANYDGRFNVSSSLGTLCSGRAQSRDEYVMLIDLASGKTISAETTQENLAMCALDCGILGTLSCTGTAQLPAQQFTPTGITVLFGGK